MKLSKIIIVLSFIIATRISVFAGEGMWIPMLLEEMNETEMQEMGFKLTAEDVYSINNSSMKDAIMLFGRGCTSELISDQGLMLTNHHCGFSNIQKHSSVEHDYLTDGFWAMDKSEELPNPGLTATLMIEMRDVTTEVFNGINDKMTEAERKALIKDNSKALIDGFEKDSPYNARIMAFYEGNQFYMIITETFRDIRLVGAPPSNIGKFGGDTDHWMWPRHTGDFSLFRVYVGKDGKPAEYSEDNIPYTPKYHFPISLKGANKGDFTMVFGYPARTEEYLPSFALELITEIGNPQKIKLRETRLDIFKKYSKNDAEVRIKYATKHARVSNYWKKMIGESAGIKRMNAIEKKQDYENRFTKWVNSSDYTKTEYGGIISSFEDYYNQLKPLSLAYDYFSEDVMAMEIIKYSFSFRRLVNMSMEKNPDLVKINAEVERLKNSTATFFKDYYKPIDKEVVGKMLMYYDQNIEDIYKPELFNKIHKKFDSDYKAYANYLFEKSIFDDKNEVEEILNNYKPKYYKKLAKDPAYKLANDYYSIFNSKLRNPLNNLYTKIDSLQRIYMKAQMNMEPGKRFYPNANFSLRVSYGIVEGYSPKDAVHYKHFTTLDGIMQKENPDIYDYVVEDRLKELYNNKDYGKYADKDGSLHVAFVASNHTSGGNSGSPVIDANGNLIGLNFDRCWEGTMSDIAYDPSVCRNISMDIRYFLFIVDKFAGAGYLVEEMDLVE
ncbi:MAG: serine protease [Marinilabiliales bacterium]|nr:MAG: serine protease [Marinilabiliales bacterium]